MRYLIIDDEPIAHRIIEGYCEELPHLVKSGNAYNAIEASGMISKKNVDLIFLDLKMPKMTGFEWLKTLSHPPIIIVTTAYKEFALEGYELDIIDYLLKPFSFPRFLKAVNKASEVQQSSSIQSPSINTEENSRFFLKGDKKHHQINIPDILFIEAYGNYTKVFLEKEMIISHEKISNMERLLPDSIFLRVHKSFLIAKNKIKHIEGNIIYIKDFKVPVGQTYRSIVNKLVSRK